MLSKEEVKHIAKLARLSLSEKEIGRFQKDLSSVLGYIDKLKEADVSGVEPASHSQKLENVMREDKPRSAPLETRKKLSESAPEGERGYWKVKPVL